MFVETSVSAVMPPSFADPPTTTKQRADITDEKEDRIVVSVVRPLLQEEEEEEIGTFSGRKELCVLQPGAGKTELNQEPSSFPSSQQQQLHFGEPLLVSFDCPIEAETLAAVRQRRSDRVSRQRQLQSEISLMESQTAEASESVSLLKRNIHTELLRAESLIFASTSSPEQCVNELGDGEQETVQTLRDRVSLVSEKIQRASCQLAAMDKLAFFKSGFARRRADHIAQLLDFRKAADRLRRDIATALDEEKRLETAIANEAAAVIAEERAASSAAGSDHPEGSAVIRDLQDSKRVLQERVSALSTKRRAAEAEVSDLIERVRLEYFTALCSLAAMESESRIALESKALDHFHQMERHFRRCSDQVTAQDLFHVEQQHLLLACQPVIKTEFGVCSDAAMTSIDNMRHEVDAVMNLEQRFAEMQSAVQRFASDPQGEEDLGGLVPSSSEDAETIRTVVIPQLEANLARSNEQLTQTQWRLDAAIAAVEAGKCLRRVLADLSAESHAYKLNAAADHHDLVHLAASSDLARIFGEQAATQFLIDARQANSLEKRLFSLTCELDSALKQQSLFAEAGAVHAFHQLTADMIHLQRRVEAIREEISSLETMAARLRNTVRDNTAERERLLAQEHDLETSIASLRHCIDEAQSFLDEEEEEEAAFARQEQEMMKERGDAFKRTYLYNGRCGTVLRWMHSRSSSSHDFHQDQEHPFSAGESDDSNALDTTIEIVSGREQADIRKGSTSFFEGREKEDGVATCGCVMVHVRVSQPTVLHFTDPSPSHHTSEGKWGVGLLLSAVFRTLRRGLAWSGGARQPREVV
jgi:hypothetical protein